MEYCFPMSNPGRRCQQQSRYFFPDPHKQGSVHFGLKSWRFIIPTSFWPHKYRGLLVWLSYHHLHSKVYAGHFASDQNVLDGLFSWSRSLGSIRSSPSPSDTFSELAFSTPHLRTY